MFGSQRTEFAASGSASPVEIYPVNFAGKLAWGWRRREPDLKRMAQSETLFADYVTCLCDAYRSL